MNPQEAAVWAQALSIGLHVRQEWEREQEAERKARRYAKANSREQIMREVQEGKRPGADLFRVG